MTDTVEAIIERFDAAPLADPDAASELVAESVGDILRMKVGTRRAYQLVEHARNIAVVTHEEIVPRLTGGTVPLSGVPLERFGRVTAMWSALATGYAALVRRASAGDEPQLLPLFSGRTLESLSGSMLAHFAVRRALPASFWRALHQAYAEAESRGIERTPMLPGVADSITARELYVRALLLHVSIPYGLRPRELEWATRWTWRWAHKASLRPAVGVDSFFGVDLKGSEAPAFRAGAGEGSLRLLDLSELRRSLRKRMKGIDLGIQPTELGLGQDCDPAEAWALLAKLHSRWFETPIPRRAPRRSRSGSLQASFGFDAIYDALGGPRPIGPKRFWNYGRKQLDELFVFGAASAQSAATVNVPVETWTQLDHSAHGYRMQRHSAGHPIGLHQLIAIRAPESKGFNVGYTRWVEEDDVGGVSIGVELIPTAVLPVGVRERPSDNKPDVEFAPGFIQTLAANDPPSLIVKEGPIKAGALLDVRVGEEYYSIIVDDVIERGFDHLRLGFELAPAEDQPKVI